MLLNGSNKHNMCIINAKKPSSASNQSHQPNTACRMLQTDHGEPSIIVEANPRASRDRGKQFNGCETINRGMPCIASIEKPPTRTSKVFFLT